MQILFNLKNSFFIKVWFIPATIFYIFSLFQGNIYTNGKILLAYLVSLIFIIVAILISSFLYNDIQNDIVSEIPPQVRIFKIGLKVNIALVLILLTVYWSFSH